MHFDQTFEEGTVLLGKDKLRYLLNEPTLLTHFHRYNNKYTPRSMVHYNYDKNTLQSLNRFS